MKLTFLSAECALVKRFTLNGGSLEKSPYPNAYLFTSHTHGVSDLSSLCAALTNAASYGQCLLKGTLGRDLSHESRAGSTESQTSTEFICFDIDGTKALTDIEAFMSAVGLPDISYIVQYSASMGIDTERGLSAHVFCMLSAAVAAPFLKQWLIKLNLEVPALRAEIGLTRTGNALRWPLDITTCQNDKLIYIAPPELGSDVINHFKGERIALIIKARPCISSQFITANIAANQKQSKELLNELRKAAGYTVLRDSQYKVKNGLPYLAKPGEAVLTGIKEEREFTYFNLNGGDSWGYYHSTNNPEFIHNFKGEPAYRTEDLLPEYWKQLKATTSPEQSSNTEYLVFRNIKNDRCYNGFYDRDRDEVQIFPAAKQNLKDFLKQYGQPVPDTIEDWNVIYDPQNSLKYDPANKCINQYRPSEFHALEKRVVKALPPIARRIIEHAVGKGEIFWHFINWFAYILQYRSMTGTAWVLHGNPGTGKGLLFHQILARLLGRHNVHNMLMGDLESQYNGYMETAQLILVDEVQMSALLKSKQAGATLKNHITELFISIRQMYASSYVAPNFGNFILASNMPDPVHIEVFDRRYNAGNFQKDRLIISEEEVSAGLPAELEDIYMFFMSYAVDKQKAHTILNTADRQLLISVGRTSVDEVADALLHGDLEYLLDQLPSSSDPIFATPTASAYKNLMDQLILTGREWSNLSRDELFIIYDYCVGGMARSPNKFTAMLKHHRIHTKRIRRENRLFYGIDITWKHNEEWFAARTAELTSGVPSTPKVVQIKKAKVQL